MSKRIYVAAPWVDRDSAKSVAELLRSKGHVITHSWWNYEGENQSNESYDFLRGCATQDYFGVTTADLVLVLNSFKSEGKAVEQGIAIATGKPIICITGDVKPSSNIFHYLPCYRHVKTLEEALEVISE